MSGAYVCSFTSGISPYEMAQNLCAVFTEFPPGAPERCQALYAALDGEGRTHEPKLVWLLASSRVCRGNFADLVFALIDQDLLSDFYADDELICRYLNWNMLERPCRTYVALEAQRKTALRLASA